MDTHQAQTMNLEQRQAFFRGLRVQYTSGIPLPKSLSNLANDALCGKAANATFRQLERGKTICDALISAGLPDSEATLVQAGFATGRADSILDALEGSCADRRRVRRKVLRSALYPLSLLHLAPLLLAIPISMVQGGGYLNIVVPYFVGLYVFTAMLLALGLLLLRWYRNSALLAQIIEGIPGLGRTLKLQANVRFAQTASLYVSSGQGILKGLRTASVAAGSQLLRALATQAIQQIQAGESLATAFSGSPAGLEADLASALQNGDHSGRMAEELDSARARLAEQLANRIQMTSEWLPRLLYMVTALAVGAMILWMAKHMAEQLGNQLLGG